MWYGEDMMWYTLLYEMIIFCKKLSATGRSLMVVALLYEMQSPCICFTLSLCVSDSCRSNSWQDNNDATMEIKVSSRWCWKSWRCFGDGNQRHKMMMAISCYIFWLHVMFIFYASYFDSAILLDEAAQTNLIWPRSWDRFHQQTCNLTTAGPCWRLKQHTWRKIIVVLMRR